MLQGNHNYSFQPLRHFLYGTLILVSLLLTCRCSGSDDPTKQPGAAGPTGSRRGEVAGAAADPSGRLKKTGISFGGAGQAASCTYCHPVNKPAGSFADIGGYGFADLVQSLNFPYGECLAPKVEAFNGLFWSGVPVAARLVGVRCAACHGFQSGLADRQITPRPGASAPVLIGFFPCVCGACHGRFTRHGGFGDARQTGSVNFNNFIGSSAPAAGPLSARCACCHTAQR